MLDAWSAFRGELGRSRAITAAGLQASQKAPASVLIDLLEALPDVFAAHVGPHLTPDARKRLKQACRVGLLASDRLTTAATVDNWRRLREVEDSHPGDQWVRRESWQQAFAGFPAFLRRLPSLSELTLNGWPSEAELSVALLACGEATQGRVTALTLFWGWLTVTALCAVPLAFPRLAELTIEDPSSACRGTECTCCRPELQGPLLLPLQGLQSLTKLSFRKQEDGPTHRDLLLSVGQLSSLCDLQLYLDTGSIADLHLLSGLVSLHTCYISTYSDNATLVDFSALFSATRLTSLRLTGALSSGAHEHSVSAVAAVMARLGALTALRSLVLSCCCPLDDDTFSAIRHLTLLTELEVGRAELTAPPGPGHLPLLQRLIIAEYNYLAPSELLQPLLPLPSLTSLNGNSLNLLVGHVTNGSVTEQRAELRTLVGYLLAAPRLQLLGGVELSVPYVVDVKHAFSAERLVRALIFLGPLSHLYSRVLLYDLEAMEPQWGRLMRGLGGLVCLELRYCRLRGLHLTCLLRHLTALTHLELRNCVIGRGALEELAAECRRSLVVEVVPRLSVGMEARCRALQQRVYCLQYITWAWDSEVKREEDSDSEDE